MCWRIFNLVLNCLFILSIFHIISSYFELWFTEVGRRRFEAAEVVPSWYSPKFRDYDTQRTEYAWRFWQFFSVVFTFSATLISWSIKTIFYRKCCPAKKDTSGDIEILQEEDSNSQDAQISEEQEPEDPQEPILLFTQSTPSSPRQPPDPGLIRVRSSTLDGADLYIRLEAQAIEETVCENSLSK